MSKFASVDDYVASLPASTQAVLTEVRRRARSVAPDGQEVIRYDMPTVQVEGMSIVHFAGWKSHLAIYPAPHLDETLEPAVRPYLTGKGTLQFPLNQPIPYDLIERLIGLLRDQR